MLTSKTSQAIVTLKNSLPRSVIALTRYFVAKNIIFLEIV